MLLLLGREGTQTATFAKRFASEKLKTSVEILNETTLETMLPRMTKSTPILIEKGCNAGKLQEKLLKTINERDMVLFMVDSKAGDLQGYATISPDGKYVAVRNNSKGRRQQILVIDEDIESSNALEAEKPNPPSGEVKDQKIPSNVAPASTVEDGKDMKDQKVKVQKVKDQKVKVQKVKDQKIPSNVAPASTVEDGKDMLTELALFLMDSSRTSETTYYWEDYSNIKFMNYSGTPQVEGEHHNWLSKGTVKAFYTLSFVLYATKNPRNKWIKFQLTDAVGMNSIMGNNDNNARGFFNDNAFIHVFPGSGDVNRSSLPSGWSRPHFEPQTPNSATTYTSTTGFEVGVTGTGSPGGPSAEVSASVHRSNAVKETINDFSVRNISDGSMSGWNFYYTAMDGDNWKKQVNFWGQVEGIADLAKSTISLNAEAIYQGPPDRNDVMQWSTRYVPRFSLVASTAFMVHYYNYTITSQRGMTIDTGRVKNPDL